MNIAHNLRMDLARCGCKPIVGAVQGESNTRSLIIALYDNGIAWEVPAGVTAAVAFRKPDGTKGLYDTLPDGTPATNIDGSTVKITLAPQALTAAGDVFASVIFTDADLDQLATFPFRIRVEPNPAAGEVVSNDYYSHSTLKEINDAIDAVAADLEDLRRAVVEESAHIIVCSAQGQVVALNDTSSKPLRSLRLFGKTTQNGTPTPDAPIDLVSAGSDGNIAVKVYGKNLVDMSDWVKQGAATIAEDGSYYISKLPMYNAYGRPETGKYLYKPENGSVPLVLTVTAKKDSTEASGACFGIAFCYTDGTQDNHSHYGLTRDGKSVYHTTTFKSNPNKIIDCVRFGWCTYNAWVKDCQLEFGTVATAYEPYKEPQTLTASTPNGLHGIPVSSGGNYTDSNGQQWLCDEIDFAKGVREQRIGVIESYANEEIPTSFMSTTGELTPGARVIYVLAAPIETPLSAEELEAYAHLHANKPSTTVCNDAGAWQDLTYVADTKLYIDNKFAELQSAILATGANI